MDSVKPVQRVKIFASVSDLKIAKFERMIGVTQNAIQSAIKRNSSMSDETLAKIMKTFPQLNITWVLTGKGEMLHEESTSSDKESEPIENDPDFSEVLQLISLIDNPTIAGPLKDRVYKLYYNNSQLKTDLLKIYRLIGN
ncbi:MAG: hypothetical protein WBA74_07425 [Cyclobacteriaceae bacterium]